MPVYVFVYGTLTDPAVVERVLGADATVASATLFGLARARGRYPSLVPATADDATVSGRLLAVDASALVTLDRYEAVADDLYVRVSVPVQDDRAGIGVDTVETYVGVPARLDIDARWPGAGPFEARVTRHLDRADVHVRIDADAE